MYFAVCLFVSVFIVIIIYLCFFFCVTSSGHEQHREAAGQAAGAAGLSVPGQRPETPEDAQVLPLQEPRLRVAPEGTQAVLQLAGLPVSQMQADSRAAASHGGAGNRRFASVLAG